MKLRDRKYYADEHVRIVQQYIGNMLGPDSYYVTAYRKQEAGYWGDIPTWLYDYVFKREGVSVLDIGPGYGTLLGLCSNLEATRLVGVDRVTHYLDPLVARNFGIEHVEMDIERGPDHFVPPGHTFPSIWGSFDVIIMTEVLEHFNFNPRPTIRRVVTTLKPGGRLYLSTPNRDTWGKIGPWNNYNEIPAFDSILLRSYNHPPWVDGHIWHYTPPEVMDIFETEGLRMLRASNSFSSGGSHIVMEFGKPERKP